jgi:hypothetical protein
LLAKRLLRRQLLAHGELTVDPPRERLPDLQVLGIGVEERVTHLTGTNVCLGRLSFVRVIGHYAGAIAPVNLDGSGSLLRNRTTRGDGADAVAHCRNDVRAAGVPQQFS